MCAHHCWHNAAMRRIASLPPSTLLIASIAAVMLGPLLDHHFAELQPTHSHLGRASSSGHSHLIERFHSHGPGSANRCDGGLVMVYSHESGLAVTTASGLGDQISARVAIDFERLTTWLVPAPPEVTATSRSTPPSTGPHGSPSKPHPSAVPSIPFGLGCPTSSDCPHPPSWWWVSST